jgi:prepilin-type N-terminal cleavage/methylation domain-containing protein
MKRINAKGGFTLIELLVVIAIIGILSSIVLVSLNSARTKGTNARVIGETQQIRTALETEFNGSTYPSLTVLGAVGNAGDTSTNPNIQTLAKDINTINGKTGVYSVNIYATSTSATAYAIYTVLAGGAGYVCFDSVGNASTSYTGTKQSSNTICQ